MITFVPHILYDRQQVSTGGGETTFFQNDHTRVQQEKYAHWSNMPQGSVGCLPWPFILTGFALQGKGLNRSERLSGTSVDDDQGRNLLVRLRIGEVLQWAYPLLSLRHVATHAQERWEFSFPVDLSTYQYRDIEGHEYSDWDRAREVVQGLIPHYPWAIPQKQNFCLTLDAWMAYSGKCEDLRVELHGLRAMEWG